MFYNIIFIIVNFFLLIKVVYADQEIYPTRVLTTEEKKNQEELNKSLYKLEDAPLSIKKIGTVEIRNLMEPVLSYPEGFPKLDPVREVMKEENLYSKLSVQAKEELLYKKHEKIKNFYEKKLIEKFLHFDFRDGSINNLSTYNIQYINRHLPSSLNKIDLKKRAFDYALRGNLSTLRTLIENKIIEINILDDLNKNLLMRAAQSNQIEIVRFLLMHKIDVNHKDKYGNNVLSYTAKGSILYNLLVQFGAN